MFSLILVAALFGTSGAWASKMDGFERLGSEPVECEHYLTGFLAKKAARAMKDQLFDRPFLSLGIEPVSDLALKKFGLAELVKPGLQRNLILSVEKTESTDMPVRFRIQLFAKGKLVDLHDRSFPDSTPTLWNTVWLRGHELSMDHKAILAKHPLRHDMSVLDDSDIGFSTDPDPDGVSTYVRVHYYEGDLTYNVEAGLHIPCQRLDDYVREEWYEENEESKVLTRATTMCRLPVLTFSRPDSVISGEE